METLETILTLIPAILVAGFVAFVFISNSLKSKHPVLFTIFSILGIIGIVLMVCAFAFGKFWLFFIGLPCVFLFPFQDEESSTGTKNPIVKAIVIIIFYKE